MICPLGSSGGIHFIMKWVAPNTATDSDFGGPGTVCNKHTHRQSISFICCCCCCCINNIRSKSHDNNMVHSSLIIKPMPKLHQALQCVCKNRQLSLTFLLCYCLLQQQNMVFKFQLNYTCMIVIYLHKNCSELHSKLFKVSRSPWTMS